MATKKTAVIPEEEILAAATEENINEHSLHQTETVPEPDRVLSAEGAPGDADLIDICQTDPGSANPEGMPIEDAARNTPEAPVSQTGSGTELPGEFPAGSDELTAPEAPCPRPIPTWRRKNLKRARRPAEPENQELRKVSLTQQRQNRPGMHPTASKLRRRSRAGAPLPDRRRRWYPSTSAPVWKRKRTKPATICWTW